MTPEAIARICHQANKAYCESLGETSQKDWEEAPEWARMSAIKGVEFNLQNPSASHECFLPYDQLPIEHRHDSLFKAVVAALSLGEDAFKGGFKTESADAATCFGGDMSNHGEYKITA